MIINNFTLPHYVHTDYPFNSSTSHTSCNCQVNAHHLPLLCVDTIKNKSTPMHSSPHCSLYNNSMQQKQRILHLLVFLQSPPHSQSQMRPTLCHISSNTLLNTAPFVPYITLYLGVSFWNYNMRGCCFYLKLCTCNCFIITSSATTDLPQRVDVLNECHLSLLCVIQLQIILNNQTTITDCLLSLNHVHHFNNFHTCTINFREQWRILILFY